MSTYSTNLKVQLIGTGEENGTWGDVTNNAFNNVFEQAIVGYGTVNFSSDANTTLSLANGNTSQTARNLYLNVTSSVSLSTTRDVIIPSITSGSTPIQKLYIVKNATTGSQSIRVIGASGTGITVPNGATMMVYSNGTNVVALTYAELNTSNTFLKKQSFAPTTAMAFDFANALENGTISATAATGTVNYNLLTQSVLYYTTDASGNFTVNFRGDGSTTLNSLMNTGQFISCAFLVTNGAAAKYNSGLQVDGSSVTYKWASGSAPTAGSPNAVDIYTYTIAKTASATFTVFATQAKFA